MHSVITAAVGAAATAAVGSNRRWSRSIRFMVAATTAAVTLGVLIIEGVLIYRLPFGSLYQLMFVAAVVLEGSVYVFVIEHRRSRGKGR